MVAGVQHPEDSADARNALTRLVLALASGAADVLSGRFIHVSDDLDEMVRRAGGGIRPTTSSRCACQ